MPTELCLKYLFQVCLFAATHVCIRAQGQSPANAIEAAGGDVIERQVEYVSFPRRS